MMISKCQFLTLAVVIGLLVPVATPYADSKKMRKDIQAAIRWMPPSYRTNDAVELLLGTAARESRFGKFPDRPGMGGVGIFQVNPKTEEHIWSSYLAKRPQMLTALRKATGVAGPSPKDLAGNFPYSASMSRLAYALASEPLPSSKDPVSQANYWKKWYNTSAGKGTPEAFLQTYRELIGGQK